MCSQANTGQRKRRNDGAISRVRNQYIRILFVLLSCMFSLNCGPAEPVSLSTVRFEFGETGTFFYNEAQRMVSRGSVLELSLRLPIDVHFRGSDDWVSIRVREPGKYAFGQAFSSFASGDLKSIEVVGVDLAFALCNGRLFTSEFDSNEGLGRIEVPSRAVCLFVGLQMNGRFPAGYESRQVDVSGISRVALQVERSFEQTLRVGLVDGPSGYLSAYLTIQGHLTDIPLGEGQIEPMTGLVVLSPRVDEEELGIWLLATEKRLSEVRSRRAIGVHVRPRGNGVSLEWPNLLSVSGAPADISASQAWEGELRFSEPPPELTITAHLNALTDNDRSTWRVSMPSEIQLKFPNRPFSSEEMFDDLLARYSMIWSTDDRRRFPSIGETVPRHAWQIDIDGYFRKAGCSGDTARYAYWSVLSSCEQETPMRQVLVDECGQLVPLEPSEDVVLGAFEADGFRKADSQLLEVERAESGELDVGRGASAFSLLPINEPQRMLAASFRGPRSRVTVTEQLFRAEGGQLGTPLDDAVIIYADIWNDLVPYHGLDDGQIHINAGLIDGTLVLASNERDISGWLLNRRVELCPEYTESLFLRMVEESVVVEQQIQRSEEQLIFRRLFYFD